MKILFIFLNDFSKLMGGWTDECSDWRVDGEVGGWADGCTPDTVIDSGTMLLVCVSNLVTL